MNCLGRFIVRVMILIPLALSATESSAAVSVFETSTAGGFKGLEPKPDLYFHSERPTEATFPTFDVDPRKQYQKIEGFGAAFTEACAINLLKLSAVDRREVMEKIFSKTKGAGFDIIRLPIGMSDFSDGTKPDYSYDDTPDNSPDPQFQHFDMSRDEKTFAFIREAKTINPNLRVMISPWSPPAWMKTSNSLRGGYVKAEHFDDLANYFVRVIREYKKRGIPVTSMTVQNEPGYESSMVPTTGMSAEDEAKFIGTFLGPKLANEHLATAIYIHDHNWSQFADLPIPILDDPQARHYASGVAYHCYGGNRWQMLNSMNKYPEIPTLQTECSGTLGSDLVGDFQWWLDNDSLDAINMGTTGALAWNLCLDDKGGPRVKNSCDSCRGAVTTDFSAAQPKVIYNGEFHALAQVSRFIMPGSRRIEVRAADIANPKAVAFGNPDGTISFIAQNTEDAPVTIRIRMPDQKSISYAIPARGAVSFKWESNSRIKISDSRGASGLKFRQ